MIPNRSFKGAALVWLTLGSQQASYLKTPTIDWRPARRRAAPAAPAPARVRTRRPGALLRISAWSIFVLGAVTVLICIAATGVLLFRPEVRPPSEPVQFEAAILFSVAVLLVSGLRTL